MPLTSHDAYCMADGKTCDTVETVVIAVDTDDGLTGWGEVCPIPHYLPAYARGVTLALTEPAPVLIGADPVGPEAVMAAADRYLHDHRYAKSALDIALWDITGQAAGLPLYALLGGRQAADIPLYHSITCVAPNEMARMARECLCARDAADTGSNSVRLAIGLTDDDLVITQAVITAAAQAIAV